MNRESVLKHVESLAAAKTKKDVRLSCKHYHPDIELLTPSLKGFANGIEETAEQLKVFFLLFPQYQVTIKHELYDETAQQTLMSGEVKIALDDFQVHKIKQRNKDESDKASDVHSSSQIDSHSVHSPLTIPAFFEFEFENQLIKREVFHLDLATICGHYNLSLNEFFALCKSLMTSI